jgi:hypothetical protein
MALTPLHHIGCRKSAVELHFGTLRLLWGSCAGNTFSGGRLYDYDATAGTAHILSNREYHTF